MHLRIYATPDLTPAVLSVLEATDTMQYAVFRGVAVAPATDLILAEVVREVANSVIAPLYELGVHHDGAVQMEAVDAWVSQRDLMAEARAPGAGADAVVWAEVTHRAYVDSALTWTYVTFMLLATMIASIGIVLDSQILLIGAMVLGPEFGAVAALGLALIRRRWNLLRMASRTLAVGFVIAIGITATLAVVARGLGWIDEAEVTGPRPLTAFIYTPDWWSFIIALIAGAAGVLALTSQKSIGLSGVFISVTTVPAAGNVALGLAFGAWDEVVGSSAQLLINVSCMAVSGWMTLVFQRAVWNRLMPGSGRVLKE